MTAQTSEPMIKMNKLLKDKLGIDQRHNLTWTATHSGGDAPVELVVTIEELMDEDEFNDMVSESWK